MTTEQISEYLEKRIVAVKIIRDYSSVKQNSIIASEVLKELEAVHKLTNVIQSRSSQEIKVK